MILKFFVVALRNLTTNKLYSFINITGLAIGILASMFIWLWVTEERSYDKFIPKYDRLYQVWVQAEYDNKINNWNSVPLPTYRAIKDKHSSMKNSAVSNWGGTNLIAVGDKRFVKESIYVSEEFLQMFEYEVLRGDASTALKDPTSIVLTESMGKMLFGEEDPMGKSVKIDDTSLHQVTAVLKDIPTNSSFQFDMLLPWSKYETMDWVKDNINNWGNYSFQVYVELDDPTKQAEVTASIVDMVNETKESDFPSNLLLYGLDRWRLYSNFEDGKEAGGRIDYVNLFTTIAIFLLFIACINFMNLATARSEKRIKEVGIRKSLGASRNQLIAHFLGESIFLTLISYVLAIMLVILLLPYYNDLVDKKLFIDFTQPLFWVGSLAFIVILGVMAGSYPAFFLSSFDPVKTLKGTITVGNKAVTPRKVMVTLQFAFSIIMMISTIVIFKQIELARKRDLGYNQNLLISANLEDNVAENYEVIKQQLLQSGAVEAVTKSNSRITDINSNNFLGWPGKPEDQRVIFTTIAAGYDYAETMGIKVLMGRDFSKDYATDSMAIIVNKAGLEIMNLENPIGTQLDLWGDKRRLIGVIDNVLMGSAYDPVKPLFVILNDWGGSMSIRLNQSSDIQSSLKTVQNIFEEANPAYPFEYKFMDQEFEKKFTTINLTHNLATIFAFLAIFITGLGLFGLASFTAQQRVKEIGIRKVLGATKLELIALLSKDTSRLVIISFFLAAPLSGYMLTNYLERYTLRTSIDWWIYPLAGVIALVFALVIVAQQANRVAKVNPAESLKSE
jgi:putative ABC transport system permease protein